jgi:hypothetical protein
MNYKTHKEISSIPVIPVIPVNTGYTCAHAMVDTGCTALLALSAVIALASAAILATDSWSESKRLSQKPKPTIEDLPRDTLDF